MEIMTVMILAATLLTLAVLAAGISAMATGGEIAHRSSGEWMVLRVVLQGAALILLWLSQYL